MSTPTQTDEAAVSWSDTIIKGRPFRAQFVFTNQETDGPRELANFQIDVTPNEGAPFSWTQANGKLVRQDAGKYLLDLTGEDTAALDWTSATCCFNGTEPNGEVTPCFLTGSLSTEG